METIEQSDAGAVMVGKGVGQRMDLEPECKICVVTGASKGIGLAVTRALGRAAGSGR